MITKRFPRNTNLHSKKLEAVYEVLSYIDFDLEDELIYKNLSKGLVDLRERNIRQCWIDRALFGVAAFFINSEFPPLNKLFNDVYRRMKGDENKIITEFSNNKYSLGKDKNLYYFFYEKDSVITGKKVVQTQAWDKERGIICDSVHENIVLAINSCGVNALEIVPECEREQLQLDVLQAESEYQDWQCFN